MNKIKQKIRLITEVNIQISTHLTVFKNNIVHKHKGCYMFILLCFWDVSHEVGKRFFFTLQKKDNTT